MTKLKCDICGNPAYEYGDLKEAYKSRNVKTLCEDHSHEIDDFKKN